MHNKNTFRVDLTEEELYIVLEYRKYHKHGGKSILDKFPVSKHEIATHFVQAVIRNVVSMVFTYLIISKLIGGM